MNDLEYTNIIIEDITCSSRDYLPFWLMHCFAIRSQRLVEQLKAKGFRIFSVVEPVELQCTVECEQIREHIITAALYKAIDNSITSK